MRARWPDEPTYELRFSFTALNLRRVATADKADLGAKDEQLAGPSSFRVAADVQHHSDPALLESESLPRKGLSRLNVDAYRTGLGVVTEHDRA